MSLALRGPERGEMMLSKNAKWVACGEYSAPLVVRDFDVDAYDRVTISVCGLGYYELFINGKRVGEEFYKPAFSDYGERDFSSLQYPLFDRTSHTVYYNTYDITVPVRAGKNVLAILLGNGFYRQKRRLVEGKVFFSDKLLCCYDIAVKSGKKVRHIRSDGSERAFASFIAENNLFYGETHDYTQFDFSLLCGGGNGGKGVEIVAPPCARIEKQRCPNDRVERTLCPRLVSERGNKRIYDAGENIAGFVVIESAGETVTVRHAENLTAEGELDFRSAGGEEQISQTKYIGAPAGKLVHPWFCWSGFRYFETEGDFRSLHVAVVHTDVRRTAEFFCGDPNVQWLFDAFVRTMLNNMHGGVPSDCPHRERLGYTGDGQLTAETAMLCLDSRTFYEKWMRDISDCQDIETGHIQHTAPFCGGGGGPGGWGGAAVLVPLAHYKIYGDKSFVRRYLGTMRRYIESMRTFTEGGLVVREREGGWCLGDWCTPDPIRLPEPFVNTCFYVKCMQAMQYLAGECGERADYDSEIEASKKALLRTYFDEVTGSFCGGVQGADAFAVDIGIGDFRTERNLLARCEEVGKFETGIFGTDILCDLLARKRPDLLLKFLAGEEFPSFGFMRRGGATTLWEDWDGSTSHDHQMFGACVRQLFYGLAGIRIGKQIAICPPCLPALGFLKGKLCLRGGELSIQISYEREGVRLKVSARGLEVVVCAADGSFVGKVRGEREFFLSSVKNS